MMFSADDWDSSAGRRLLRMVAEVLQLTYVRLGLMHEMLLVYWLCVNWSVAAGYFLMLMFKCLILSSYPMTPV